MKYCFGTTESNNRIRDIACKIPNSIPDIDRIEVFETPDELREYIKKVVKVCLTIIF